ncbi:hypothetical protein [Streptosporangium subroseum]|uniref:hypothetical protein n=1 Tax=Streptosporangium subroseum TaxID=106412 RepID=UPI00308811B6|nr:hypothetical protein OHB15_01650 [Streptosporangium subroseum]
MLPPYGTPGSDRLNAARWRPGARTVLQRLRTELHTYLEAADVGDLVHGDRPHFVIRTEPTTVTVWTDVDGEVFCWGTQLMEEPADQAPVEELPQVARQIAEQLGNNRTEPAAVPSSRTDACPPNGTPRS